LGDKISTDITSLANYFVTSDGEDLLDVMFNALQTSYNEKENIEIE
jgi:2,3-bisphosphoglycerate-dependent phosphoglycerate mutase